MKIGDLVKMKPCKELDILHPLYKPCKCWFCSGNSNRIGLVTGLAARNSWRVMFDCGEWRVDDFEEARGEIKVISEYR